MGGHDVADDRRIRVAAAQREEAPRHVVDVAAVLVAARLEDAVALAPARD